MQLKHLRHLDLLSFLFFGTLGVFGLICVIGYGVDSGQRRFFYTTYRALMETCVVWGAVLYGLLTAYKWVRVWAVRTGPEATAAVGAIGLNAVAWAMLKGIVWALPLSAG